MSEPGSRRGRAHNAEGAQEAILNAAEKVFAEQGFDGARIDAIAERAGYNKSLIFHYYEDKLGLYSAVLKRMDERGNELQASVLGPLLTDENLTSDANTFRTFIKAAIQLIFDVQSEKPEFARLLAWEAAEGWQSYKKIASQFNADDVELLRQILNKAHAAGLIRTEIDPMMVFSLAYIISISYRAYAPMLEMTFRGVDLLSPAAQKRARELIVEFVIQGIMADPKKAKQ